MSHGEGDTYAIPRSYPNGSYERIPPSGTPAITSSYSTATWRPGEQPIDENDTRESAVRRAHAGFVNAEVKSGRYTEEDRRAWIDAWSQAGSITAGLNYYRANHRNPPFNDRHPASTIAHSWSAKEVTEGAKSTVIKVPTLVVWGMKDTAILVGHLSGAGQVGDQSECQAVSRR